MKKQTAAVMSAVTLISSVVPVAPVSAMENQEVFEEIVEQTTEQVEGPIASSEILQEGNEIILEEAEIVNEEIKEDAVNTELPEEITDDINVESNEGEKIEVEDEEVFEEETVENMEELPSNEVIEDVTETENEMPESSTTENTEELPSNEVTEDVIETENELTESTTEENTEEAIKVEQEIETTIQSGNVTENSQEGEKTHESIAEAQEEVEIPDAFLKALINEALDRPEDPTHAVTNFEMQSITELNGEWRWISNLEGLEYATELRYLNLSYNSISNLEPLTNLKNLKALSLSYNAELSNLDPLSNLTNLTELHLNQKHGKISELAPLSNLSNLECLNLLGNEVSDLTPLSNLTKLEELGLGGMGLGGNQISDINPLSNLTSLKVLFLDCNKVTDISPISKLTNLSSLSLAANQVKDLTPLDALQSLEYLNMDLQEITLDPVYIQRGGTVVINNPLVGEWWKMKHEYYGTSIYDNGFKVENGYYDAEKNQFIFENVATDTLSFSFSNYSATDFARQYQGNTDGTVTIPVKFIEEGEAVVNIPDAKLHALINETLGRSEHPTHPITNFEMQSITELNGGGISNLDGLEYATNLKYLNISSSYEIRDLTPLTNLTQLTELSLTECGINDLNSLKGLTNLKSLTSLGLIWNGISDLAPLGNLTNLSSLDLSYNSIHDLEPLANLKNLKTLDLSFNAELRDLDSLSNLINLTDLYIIDGNIDNLEPLSNLINLKYLYLPGNEVSDLTPLSNLTKLEELDLGNMVFGGNQISDITPLSNLKSLKALYLVYNQISDLTPLDGIKSLESLGSYCQEIKLDPVHTQRGGTVVVDNPLVGKWWGIGNDNVFNIENGYYDADKNQFIFENVATDSISFSFISNEDELSTSTVMIPVIFYEISENFTDFVTNDIFNIIGGTGKLDNPLVLEVVEGTDVETIKSLLAKYNDYDLSVTKETTDTEFESYVLTFTKGEEKAIFKVQVPVGEIELINCFNSLITQSQPEDEPTQPDKEPDQPENEPTQPEDELESKPNVEKPTIQENNNTTQRPQTGLSGLIGFVGISTLALGAVFSKRKKK